MGSLAEASILSFIVAEKCSISGPGFSIKLACQPLAWGKASIPFQVWDRLMGVLSRISRQDIAIEIKDGQIQFDTIVINNPDIKVVSLDKLAKELPLNLEPADIIKLFSYGPMALKATGIWDAVRFYLRRLHQQLEKAAQPLQEYGILPEDLAEAVAKKLEIEDQQTFAKITCSED
ncbi:MAG: hypothetical protein JRI59_10375 [Deltaproteobacteria bacterium]|nr:hypothetical protein [Deltaproteobacteria bacterium]